MKPGVLFRCLSVAAVLGGLAAVPAAASEPGITIGTGSRAGIYFQVGRTICHLLAAQHDGRGCTAAPSPGSIANLQDLRAGKLQLAIVQSDAQYYALTGTGSFLGDKPDPDLRALFSVHDEPFTVVARRDAGIKRLQDLVGKQVNIGTPGSGQRGTMSIVMRAMAWEPSTFREADGLPVSQQSLALCNGRIQAMIYIVGHPNDSVAQAVRLCDAVLVGVTGRPIDILVAKYPFYSHMTIPGGLYAGNPYDVPTFGVTATVVSSAKVDADTVYAVTKAVFEHLDAFKRQHPAFLRLVPERMITKGLTAPLHEGAKRYYKERGWL